MQRRWGFPPTGTPDAAMKNRLFPVLLLLALAWVSAALGFHDHVDIDGAETLISGYRAPTETEDGSTGDEVCSVCGEVIRKATVIPAIGKQKEKAEEENITPQPPVRTAAPEKTVTPVPTARPTQKPTPSPTKTPAKTPRQDQSSSSGTPKPESDTGAAPTAKKSSPKQTPQPDLSGTERNTAFDQRGTSSESSGASSSSLPGSSSSGGTKPRGKSSSAESSEVPAGGRDLETYPVFSSRFPWRRLFMYPEAGIILTPAGIPVLPEPSGASSPLKILQIPDPEE